MGAISLDDPFMMSFTADRAVRQLLRALASTTIDSSAALFCDCSLLEAECEGKTSYARAEALVCVYSSGQQRTSPP